MTNELAKGYDPTEVEPRWYAVWKSEGLFRAKDDGQHDKSFCIMIPPPNVTGSLHMGHALTDTIEDVLTRVARMRGFNTLWLPGTDHAGIATQVVVERLLAGEGTTRQAIGREKFLERVWQWRSESGTRIYSQLELLGCSLDWDRKKFTMDPDLSRAVREAFVRLYEQGLIYRADRLVNWSVGAQTVISDLEVDRQENVDGELFSFAYPFEDGSGEIVVATTRPETILGDTAVAVHPEDPRYKAWIGKRLKAPFHDRTIPLIADAELVDMAFGTGAVKVTPAHDFNDNATGQRHNLESINIFKLDGTLNANGGPFAGLEIREARRRVKKALEEKGLSRGTKNHKMTLAKCSRTGTVLEPMLMPQWYVKMKPLAEPAIAAVAEGKIEIVPAEWTKTYMHWMTNIQDWCISRQLWWGHQIPAWHCDACGELTVSRTDVSACGKCGSTNVRQDADVLDTWFSSGLWPFSTLGWPDETAALKTFYPTSILETGYDILFFWVARMIVMGIHFMGDVPFRKVYLHGMVCDETGDKMSKVKGNVIDPLDLKDGAPLQTIVSHATPRGTQFDEGFKLFKKSYPSISEMKEGFPAFGADAVRFYLATNPPQAKRINLQLRQLERARNFANKIWNATRYALPYLEPLRENDTPVALSSLKLSTAERWILSRLAETIDDVNRGIDEFRLDECTTSARRFFWDELCDWYLELTKLTFQQDDESAKHAARVTLGVCLDRIARLLHPFMPFISEEIWQKLPTSVRRMPDESLSQYLMVAPFPKTLSPGRDAQAEREMKLLQDVIVTVRNIRGELGIKPRDPVSVEIRVPDGAERVLLESYQPAIRALTIATSVSFSAPQSSRPKGVGFGSVGAIEVLVPLAGLIDPAAEASRLQREIAKLGKDIEKLTKQLENAAFINRAPPETVAAARDELNALKLKSQRLTDALQIVGETGA